MENRSCISRGILSCSDHKESLLSYEANLSTKPTTPPDHTRLPRANAGYRWTERPEAPPTEGSQENFGLNGPSKSRFDVIFGEGRRVAGSLARLTTLPGTGLVGVATAKKIGGKPDRNRAKRRFKEAIRLQSEMLDPRLDYVFVVLAKEAEPPFMKVHEEVAVLIDQAKQRWAKELASS